MSAWALGCGEGTTVLSSGRMWQPGQWGAGYTLPCQAPLTSSPTPLGFLSLLRTQAKVAGQGATREAEACIPDPWTLILVSLFICFSLPK